MPALVNSYRFATGGSGGVGGSGSGSWYEITRSTSIVSGKISIGSLDFSAVLAARIVFSDIAVTTDDSLVSLRFHTGGSEVSSGSYNWAEWRGGGGGESASGGAAATDIHLTEAASSTHAVGNASTEAIVAVATIYHPGSSSLHKPCRVTITHSRPDGNISMNMVGGVLASTAALTGVTALASSDLTGGTVIVMGLA